MSISAINLGSTFTNANGSPVLSGFSSGLNTDSIINSLVSAQTSQVTNLQDQIKVNNSQGTALASLQQYLTQFQKAANALARPQSPDSTSNLFAFRTTSLTSNTSQAASNYLSVSADTNAPLGSYTVSAITQLATVAKQETNGFTLASADSAAVTSTATAGFFKAGTIVINGKSVTLTANESLNDVASAFNAVSNDTGITASVVKTATGTSGTNTYKLIFTGKNTGAASAFDFSAAPGGSSTVSSDPSGVLSNLTFATDQHALDAQFTYNGVQVSRPTNSVTDLAQGITFNLLQNTVGQTNANITVTVAADTQSISNGINNFAAAYNNFLTFYAQQTLTDSSTGKPVDTAVLYNDNTLKTIFNGISSVAASIVSGISSGSKTLSDIGISFTDVAATATTPAVSNALSIDTTTLQNALTNNLTGVENVFGYNAASSSANLAIYNPPTDQKVSNFTVNVNQTTHTYSAQYTDSTGVPQTVNLTAATIGGDNAIALTSPDSSGLAGLQLIYGGGGNESGITVQTTNGIANQLNNFLKTATATTSGLIAADQTAISAKTTSTQAQIDAINTQITNQKNALITKFSALEAAVSKANSALNYLNAQQAAKSS